MKNLIIGHGETLTLPVEIKSGSGPKAHPYSFNEARDKLVSDLNRVIHSIESKPSKQCADGEVIIKFIQHPSYLAKTYYPKKLFERYGLKDVGSKPMQVKPRKWATKKHPEEGLSSCIFVAGKKSNFEAMLDSIAHDRLPEVSQTLIRAIEEVSSFEAIEKIKFIDIEASKLKLEVVLHADTSNTKINPDFSEYAGSLGGYVDWKRSKTVGGLTFVEVFIEKGKETELAEFSHLRVLRSMPKLRVNKPDALRVAINETFELPAFEPLNNNFKVCIFDGGLGSENIIGDWVNEIIPPDVQGSHPSLLAHGGEVCSTYLFGPFDTNIKSFQSPYTNVDIVRVLCPNDADPDLFDVLNRIENVLKQKKYKYVNFSLGPRLPVEDDEVHVWTSVIDTLLQDGHCFATVAVGNDGELSGDFGRIQPPSDMVNCFAVGASTTSDSNWERASYSCKGPGRSPGFVKPDGVIFGGSDDNLFKIYSPQTHSIIGTQGTSYAAPFTLRVAAGIDAITDFDLSTTAIKALLIHRAYKGSKDINDVGWGKLPCTPEEVIECKDDEAIIVYQGELPSSGHLRIPIPVPDGLGLDCKWVHLKATFCFNANIDPEHPQHYTRSGLVISFRAHKDKKKDDTATHADTITFFSNEKMYEPEAQLREDAHKWETCISKEHRFKKSTLLAPVFDVKFHAREHGASPENKAKPLNYSLVLSIRAEGETETYNKILQQNQTLQTIKVTNRIRLTK
jgi:hypothetical protein